MAVVLLLVPVLQAAGTNVPLIYVTVECVAMWMALILMLVAHLDRSHVAVTAVLADLAVFVVGTALVAGSTTLVDPFNAGHFSEDTVRVPGSRRTRRPGSRRPVPSPDRGRSGRTWTAG